MCGVWGGGGGAGGSVCPCMSASVYVWCVCANVCLWGRRLCDCGVVGGGVEGVVYVSLCVCVCVCRDVCM